MSDCNCLARQVGFCVRERSPEIEASIFFRINDLKKLAESLQSIAGVCVGLPAA